MRAVSRREVIKRFALGVAVSNLVGNGWAASLLLDFRAQAHVQQGILRIRLSEFPDLESAGGSVRVGTSPVVRMSAQETRPAGIFQPVIINRGAGGEFHVLHAECTHAGCTVNRMNAQGIMQCPCHFSQFNIDGSVRQGPAAQPLERLNFTATDGELVIEVPDVFYEIRAERVTSASRVKLRFIGFSSIVYEIYFRPSLTGPRGRVAFATSPDGPLDQTELPGADDFANVYLERPGAFGFFEIAMKTSAV